VPEQQRVAANAWVGRVLAGNRIEALVGEGGMGMVFRATHLRLNRTVALKILPPALSADEAFRRRFEREAAIAASLEHPNVVPIYDAGHSDGVLYLSMRFVAGEDLGAVLRHEGRLDVGRLCSLLAPVADALDAVHEAGLVHRDVKPGNVLIANGAHQSRSRGGPQVYLCDFGIAKGPSGSDLTSAGQFVGTLQYSSPEQIEGGWLTGRSDQYSLACLTFRCLTGQVVYPRTEAAAVIYAHLTADPPLPSRARADLPLSVDAAVTRATAKNPDHRFPSCSAFIAALQAPAPPAPRKPQPWPREQRMATAPGAPPRRSLPPTLPLPEPAEPDAPTNKVEAIPEQTPAPDRVAGRASVDGRAAGEQRGAALPGPDRRAAGRLAADPGTGSDPTPAPEAPAPGSGAPAEAATAGRHRAPDAPEHALAGLPNGSGGGGRGATPAGSGAAAAQRGPDDQRAEPAGRDRAPAAEPQAAAESPAHGRTVPAPVDVRAERAGDDHSITVAWTAGGPQEVEYKITRRITDDRWHVVGRTRSTTIVDGAVAPDAEIPVYGVVARLGAATSEMARSSDPRQAPAGKAEEPAPAQGSSDDIPPVQHLVRADGVTLEFDWPSGITEAMVVVRGDQPPSAPDDPAATAWKITNMRYQLDGGLVLPTSVARPCHVAVASCTRAGTSLVVASAFDPSARITVPA
jgi:serine/threonine protein kinase